METKIIKGDFIKDKIFYEVKKQVAGLREQHHQIPGIAFVVFDCVPLAKYNIPLHVNTAQAMGFRVFTKILDNDAAEKEVFRVIDRLNADEAIHAIVLLQPLPEHLNPVRIIYRIDPVKEVEGFHPVNMMATMIPDIRMSKYPMCLPEALFEMLREEEIRLQKDQEWVFLLDEGFFSNTLTRMIVRSAAARVVPDNCPVTFVSKSCANMAEHCKRADILVVVSKYPEYVRSEWLKPGVIIIDIYSNLVKEVPSKTDPEKLVPVIRGGVNVAALSGLAGAILPIPGGLMTVVMAILFRNTVIAFRNHLRTVGSKIIHA
jgi:methylenetetrahydrofolate dehydrogenase (NADP+)/methenyltetrahydrofolate cyclohydrolase